MTEALELAEHAVGPLILWAKLAIEVAGAFWIAVGAVRATVQLLQAHAIRGTAVFAPIRLSFSRYLSLGLEFQLAADILGTAVAPTWTEIGKLGATAIIRSALNFFLSNEIKEQRGREGNFGTERPEPALRTVSTR